MARAKPSAICLASPILLDLSNPNGRAALPAAFPPAGEPPDGVRRLVVVFLVMADRHRSRRSLLSPSTDCIQLRMRTESTLLVLCPKPTLSNIALCAEGHALYAA